MAGNSNQERLHTVTLLSRDVNYCLLGIPMNAKLGRLVAYRSINFIRKSVCVMTNDLEYCHKEEKVLLFIPVFLDKIY